MLLLSQGKLRYFLNVGDFPKERVKDTILAIPGSFSKVQRDWISSINSYFSNIFWP